jgi:hypothetical protein
MTRIWEFGSGDIQVLFRSLPGAVVKLLRLSVATLRGERLKDLGTTIPFRVGDEMQ